MRKVGFDWPDIDGVIAKVEEEHQELVAASKQSDGPVKVQQVCEILNRAQHPAFLRARGRAERNMGRNQKFQKKMNMVPMICEGILSCKYRLLSYECSW